MRTSQTLGMTDRSVTRRRVLQTTGALTGAGALALLASSARGQQTVDFGEVPVGATRVQQTSQPNPTDQELQVTAITITGADADQFSVASGDAPFTLAPGESHTIAFRFTPSSTGEHSATVQIEIGGQATETAGQLVGTGVDPDQTTRSSATDEPSTSDQDSSADAADDSTETTTLDESTTETDEDESSTGESGDESAAADSPTTSPSTSSEDPPPLPDDLDEDASEVSFLFEVLDVNNDGVVDVRDLFSLFN